MPIGLGPFTKMLDTLSVDTVLLWGWGLLTGNVFIVFFLQRFLPDLMSLYGIVSLTMVFWGFTSLTCYRLSVFLEAHFVVPYALVSLLGFAIGRMNSDVLNSLIAISLLGYLIYLIFFIVGKNVWRRHKRRNKSTTKPSEGQISSYLKKRDTKENENNKKKK